MQLNNINVVMVGTTHPGNIGAAARAMKNMAISKLRLVTPQCSVDEVAQARASGADSILEAFVQFDCVSDAVADCELVIGASARVRSTVWPELSPAELAQKVAELDDKARVAVVFGPEHSGLTTADLGRCNYMLKIPTNPNFCSLNLASAIQIVAYELFQALDTPSPSKEPSIPMASNGDVQRLLDYLEQALIRHEYIDLRNPGLLMLGLSRLCLRAEMTTNEVNILRGIAKLLD